MLRQIIVIFAWLSLLYLPPAVAENAVRGANAEPAQQVNIGGKHGALFMIRHEDHTLYLFGTIHVGKEDFFPFEPIVSRALAHASKVALEIDPADVQSAQQAVLKYAMYPPGSALSLTPELRAQVAAQLKKYGIPYEVIAQMKPWMVAVLLTLGEFTMHGYQPEYAVDMFISRSAHLRQQPVIALETIDDQLGLFDKLTDAEQIEFLEHTVNDLRNPASAKKAILIAQLWRNADARGLDALAAELEKDTRSSAKFMKQVLLDGRNVSLADSIAALLKQEKNGFAAVGILHLVGANGIPAILQRQGYLVERVY